MGEGDSQPCFVVLILLTALAFGATIGFNYLAGNPTASGGLFLHGIGNVSAKYELQITPDGWTFAIWGVIYALMFGWILYSVVNICRRVDGLPAYQSPLILSPSFFVTFTLNCVSNIVWLFVWDREHVMASAPILGLTAMTCYLSLAMAYQRFDKYLPELVDDDRRADIVTIRLFVFNGLAMYAAWTTIATLLNVGSALAYASPPVLSQTAVSIFCLTLLALAFTAFLVLDLTVLKRFSRFTFSPYLVLLWALGGIMSKNFDRDQTVSIMLGGLWVLGLVAVILKVVSYFRQKRAGDQAYRRLKVWSTNDIYPALSVK